MESAFQQFNQIDGQIARTYHAAAVKFGLSDSELWVLYYLLVRGPRCLQAELCHDTGLSRSTVNSALKRLEKEDILCLSPGSGRNVCLSLTEAGAALAERTAGRLIALENEIYRSWSPEEQALLIRLNRDFAEKLSACLKKL